MNIQKKAVDLTDLAVGILVLGVLVSIGSVILIGIRDSRLTSLATEEIVNEVIIPDDTGTEFAGSYFINVTECYNKTTAGNVPIAPTGNYTISTSGAVGIITNTSATYSASFDKGNGWYCNYSTYNTTRADWTLPDNASIGLGEYGNWFKIIVIVGVAAVILSLIFMAFGKGRTGESGVGGSY